MVDIETLGTDPGAAILSVGAVEFGAGWRGGTFYRSVDLESCQDAGLEIDAGTLSWWLDKDEDLREVLSGGDELADVLGSFTTFYGDADEIWANSPSFDCEMLEAAYEAVGMTEPWEYYQERCYRTLKNLPGAVEIEQTGDSHHALDDAIYQADRTAQTLKKWEDS
jgi:DNA polymerase III epsilon subunit-like protein